MMTDNDMKELLNAANGFAFDLDAGDLNTNRDTFIAGAQWQKEQFEKNRLSACDAQTEEEVQREMDFAINIIKKEHRQPTYSDAIEYGMRLQKEKMIDKACKWLETINIDYYQIREGVFSKELVIDFRKAMEEEK